jgi:hypothetical protein
MNIKTSDPCSVLYRDMATAKDNCPGTGYELQSDGRLWWWQRQLVDPHQDLLKRVEELERQVRYLESRADITLGDRRI